MSFVRMLAQEHPFIVVTLEETFDAKNLVGTYVCNEVGEFVFKKGPLTVAAETGMWLILRNIDKSPPDLLSFLLPLVKEDTLQVTATFSITPKLGFRIIALSSTVQLLDESTSLSPFLSALRLIQLDKLQSRSDFKEILASKYQTVFAIGWLREFLFKIHSIIEERMNTFKGRLLDFKRFSVK